MNERNEDEWDETDGCEELRKLTKQVDFITGVIVGLIAVSIAYLIAFHI